MRAGKKQWRHHDNTWYSAYIVVLRTRATNLRLLEAQKRERAPLGRSEHLVVGDEATHRFQEERLTLTTLSARSVDDQVEQGMLERVRGDLEMILGSYKSFKTCWYSWVCPLIGKRWKTKTRIPWLIRTKAVSIRYWINILSLSRFIDKKKDWLN